MASEINKKTTNDKRQKRQLPSSGLRQTERDRECKREREREKEKCKAKTSSEGATNNLLAGEICS